VSRVYFSQQKRTGKQDCVATCSDCIDFANYPLPCERGIGKLTNMKATLLMRRRVVDSDRSFAEYVLWQLPDMLPTSTHKFEYRLAYDEENTCVVQHDNEAGKGDHRHFGEKELQYVFSSSQQLIADFEYDIARWKRENSNS